MTPEPDELREALRAAGDRIIALASAEWETARSRARWRALALAEAVALLACLVALA